MLKKIRIIIAILVLTLFTFYLIDFSGLLPDQFHFIAHLQFIPALMTATNLNFLFLIILLLLTFLFGRIYCSILCPLGVLQDFINWIAKKIYGKKKRFSYSKPKNILRYVILAVVALAFVFNFTLLIGLLDPYSAFGRIATQLFKPVYLFGNNLLAKYFEYTEDYYLLEVQIAITSIFTFITAIITLLTIGILSWLNGRTYCNTICPVGTLLGLASKFSIFKIRINEEKCNNCGLCSMNCKASCIDSKNEKIDYSRCVTCFNCIEKCNKNAISFTTKKNNIPVIPELNNISEIPQQLKNANNLSNNITFDGRRKFLQSTLSLTSFATASVILPKSLLAINPQAKPTISTKKRIPITPPGSLSQKNLILHCSSCHLCIARCPTNVLRPAKLEYGISGIMMPTMNYENSYCKYDCDICSKVCPNTAIVSFETLAAKQQTQIGYAVYEPKLCQVNTMNIQCVKCAAECPVQAITLVQNTINDHQIPVVNIDKCIGCGICEYICPTLKGEKAIFVNGYEEHKVIGGKKQNRHGHRQNNRKPKKD